MEPDAPESSVDRVIVDGFPFPLGVYPVERSHPRSGYTVDFEPADGGDADSDWEEWPDRYMFDIVAPADRIRPLVRSLLALLPARVYPILDVLGEDAYREVDPYIAYDPVPLDRFLDATHRHKEWLFEDGLVGFGAMSEDPFLYIYVDEHKIVTVRASGPARERVEKVLEAFDIAPVAELAGVDATAHEHRSVLGAGRAGPSEEEILEELLVAWRLQINIDRETNIDDSGDDLGVTAWRCLVRLEEEDGPAHYGDVWVRAGCYDDAERFAVDAAADAAGFDIDAEGASVLVIIADRMTPEDFARALERFAEETGRPRPIAGEVGVVAVRVERVE